MDTGVFNNDVIDDIDKIMPAEDAFNLFSIDSYLQTQSKTKEIN